MPNQEKVSNRPASVTYHDKPAKLPQILLPIRELMQALSAHARANSFCTQMEQDWESRGFKMEQLPKNITWINLQNR